jgi:hypothetical protein
MASGWLDQIQQQAEQGGLAGTIVPYQSKTLALGNFKMVDVQNGLCSVFLC